VPDLAYLLWQPWNDAFVLSVLTFGEIPSSHARCYS
jgi:hypothetical protein